MIIWGELLTRDYVPGITPYIRWLKTPMGSLGLAAAASALCGMFLHPQGFLVTFGVFVVAALGFVWPWLSLRGVAGSLSFDRTRCREGDTVAARLRLVNRMPWGAWGVSVQGRFGQADGDYRHGGVLAGLAFVPGWRTTDEAVRFVPYCRGEYPQCSPRVVSAFPFGLCGASRPLSVLAPLLVWPRTFPVAPVPDGEGGQKSEGLAVRNRAGTWGDPMGVRPYRRGDPLRRVNWGQTARHGELIVCEVQADAVPRVQLVLDANPAIHGGAGADGSREWSIRIAASLAEGWTSQGAEVQLVVDGTFVPARGCSARARSAAMLDALARIPPGSERALAEMLSLPRRRGFERGLRVIVTTDVGLRGMVREGSWRAGDRFVVLKASAFGDGGCGNAPDTLPVVPWVWIDGPERVAMRFSRAGKEAVLGH